MEKKKILIIDDEIEMVEMETMRLKASGYDVCAAYDAHRGLEEARRWGPDLVILDVMLPKMDGYQVCAELKKDRACGHVPIILVSAMDKKYDSDLGKKAGADYYLMKPFEPANLLAKIKELLQKNKS